MTISEEGRKQMLEDLSEALGFIEASLNKLRETPANVDFDTFTDRLDELFSDSQTLGACCQRWWDNLNPLND